MAPVAGGGLRKMVSLATEGVPSAVATPGKIDYDQRPRTDHP